MIDSQIHIFVKFNSKEQSLNTQYQGTMENTELTGWGHLPEVVQFLADRLESDYKTPCNTAGCGK